MAKVALFSVIKWTCFRLTKTKNPWPHVLFFLRPDLYLFDTFMWYNCCIAELHAMASCLPLRPFRLRLVSLFLGYS
jgi:hypothetical protein